MERVASDAFLLEHVAGPDQLVDILTKPLHSAKFTSNRDKLLIDYVSP
jgi:hypothetical protein